MKIQYFFLILIIAKIYCDDDYYCSSQPSSPSADECKKVKTGSGYCCYYEAPKSTISKGCISISKYQYDNIKDFVKYHKKFGGDKEDTEDKDAKIDCKSSYLQFSLIILTLLFL